jgi:hypothetical protein
MKKLPFEGQNNFPIWRVYKTIADRKRAMTQILRARKYPYYSTYLEAGVPEHRYGFYCS